MNTTHCSYCRHPLAHPVTHTGAGLMHATCAAAWDRPAQQNTGRLVAIALVLVVLGFGLVGALRDHLEPTAPAGGRP